MPKPPDAGPSAGGAAAALNSLRFAARRTGPLGAVQLLRRVNQAGGFDCPGCAWPDPAARTSLEFCENGAKHVAHEATRSRVGPEFFAAHTVSDLLSRSDQWLEAQGRITRPFRKAPGDERYTPIGWDDAFARIGTHLRELGSPDEAVLYTSGRTSNEAAFLWQLFARELGTNNLPDCSNLCHESSGAALHDAIGVGKGTVGLADFEKADAIFVIGQNPGSNHPRMFTTLLEAKARGARIVSINPLRERALVRFAHPKDPLAVLRGGRSISDLYVQVRVGGDVALLKAVMKELLEMERRAPGSVLDLDFLRRHTEGFDAFREALEAEPWELLVEESGVARAEVRELASLYAGSQRVIVCWCMGLTQHPHAVANVQEIVNLLLLRGNIGTPGAGPCPVRGHSNVQGDRTMGVSPWPSAAFLERLGAEFGFQPPQARGLDSVGAIHALHEGRAKVFLSMGGNFAVATPDAELTHPALRRARLTVQISTTLNRSHLVCGEEALILPCLGRTERDEQAGGLQMVTVENSMSVVHPSRGSRDPASPELRSEPAIVAGIARATLGAKSVVPWEELVADYDRIRERIARVVRGCEEMNRRVRQPGGFVLPSGARTRHFETPSGRARFRVHPVPRSGLAPGQLTLMTIRSHDQFNTTVYGPDDRYRGVKGDRRVLLLHPDDLEERGLAPGQPVDVTSHFEGRTRTVRGFTALAYDLPRRSAAAYFPEANALVPVESVADKSRTPTYKNVVVSVTAAAS
jgi:molybdopterin-dependent oxidoreductase alpha subunit